MDTKFEGNVASEMPKTKRSLEPSLPWKVTSDDLDKIMSAEEGYRSTVTGAPPLRTRPFFLVSLLTAIFAAALYFVSVTVMENETVHKNIQKKEMAVAMLKTDLEKVNIEKSGLYEGLAQSEKRARDLNARKELFTSVIESLTKKGNEPRFEKGSGKAVPRATDNLKNP